MMTPKEANLYHRICQLELDDPAASYPFSAKIAWEYQWSGVYTYRVIQEYKKFVFLIVVTNQSLAPSTIIDRVWHLHILYTRFYWDDFCDKILHRPLHHYPSLGGKEEAEKHYEKYCHTLKVYQTYFADPPTDIWHPPQWGGEQPSYQWVDHHQYWIIRKPKNLKDLIPKLDFFSHLFNRS